ncbi:MAG: hypothetical protein ACF8XB_15125 [Planctomycetota bacterium JB042]
MNPEPPPTTDPLAPEESRPSLARELKGLVLLYLVMSVFAGLVAFQCVPKPP